MSTFQFFSKNGSQPIFFITCVVLFIFISGCNDSSTKPNQNSEIFRMERSRPLSGHYLELHSWDSTFIYVQSDSAINSHPIKPGDAILFWTGRYISNRISDSSWSFDAVIDSILAWDKYNKNQEQYRNYVIVRTLKGTLIDQAEIHVKMTGTAFLGGYFMGNGGSNTSNLTMQSTDE